MARLLSRLHHQLTQAIGVARKNGNDQRYAELLMAARIIKRLQREEISNVQS